MDGKTSKRKIKQVGRKKIKLLLVEAGRLDNDPFHKLISNPYPPMELISHHQIVEDYPQALLSHPAPSLASRIESVLVVDPSQDSQHLEVALLLLFLRHYSPTPGGGAYMDQRRKQAPGSQFSPPAG
ncbi:hypothetical protein Sjap_003943 [Stephania japonica]|uniref:Uncharacterized protein n=1 Tax=Stephania japonica TaxID=461633 RepID=A0AAP0KPS3_9MAGN